MRKKPNLEEIEKTIDFEGVARKLDDLTETGGLKRRKKVGDLLDKVKPALLRARANRVSFQALAAFLNDSGIPVSEPTLRHYLNAQKPGKKGRRKTAPKDTPKPAEKAASAPSWKKPAAETPGRKLPPRLARRNDL